MAFFGWIEFWKEQKGSFDSVMQIGTSFFTSQLLKRRFINPFDQILDYGCGPGFMMDSLESEKVSITGVDINEFFLNQCKKNHPNTALVKIESEVSRNKVIFENHFKEKKFNLVILLSVTQYLKNVEELDNIVRLVYPYMDNNGKIVIADVIGPKSLLALDAFSLFYQCLKCGKISSYVRFIAYLLFSNYRNLTQTLKLLKLSSKDLRHIANEHRMGCQEIHGLTIHTSRTNYVLTKK